MFYLDSNLKFNFKLLPVESVGRIIKSAICEEFTENLNEVEKALYLEIKQFNEGKKENRKQAALKRWNKIKQEKTQKGDLPKRELQKKYNNKGFNYDPYSQSNYNNIPQKHFDSLLNQRILESETVI